MNIQIRRVYEATAPSDGYRVLVDRLWPRGLRKSDAKLDEWAKDLAPSDDLRHWYAHDPERWEAFRHRYALELEANEALVTALMERCPGDTLTLLYASKEPLLNNAAVLKDFIEGQTQRHPRR